MVSSAKLKMVLENTRTRPDWEQENALAHLQIRIQRASLREDETTEAKAS
jgi:hypothetical protein